MDKEQLIKMVEKELRAANLYDELELVEIHWNKIAQIAVDTIEKANETR